MAYATQITLSTGNKVSIHYQSQEVSVSVTYQLEREDADVLAVVKEKTVELAQAHLAAWQTLRDAKLSGVNETAPEKPEPKSESSTTTEKTQQTVVASEQPPEMLASPESSSPAPRITPGQLAALILFLTEAKWSEERRRGYLRGKFSCNSVDELSAEQAKAWLLELQRAEREAAQTASQQRRLENAHRNGTP
jgi:hypothetical protein